MGQPLVQTGKLLELSWPTRGRTPKKAAYGAFCLGSTDYGQKPNGDGDETLQASDSVRLTTTLLPLALLPI